MRCFPFVIALLAVGCAGPEDDLERINHPPRAALRAPVIAPIGDGGPCESDADCALPHACDPEASACRVFFDAACPGSDPCVSSLDMDGDPLTFIFQFNDGTAALHTPNPLVFHTFTQEGVFTVLVEVIDLHGATSLAAQDISIRGEYPDPPDFCDVLRPCVVGDECVNPPGVCYSNGGTL